MINIKEKIYSKAFEEGVNYAIQKMFGKNATNDDNTTSKKIGIAAGGGIASIGASGAFAPKQQKAYKNLINNAGWRDYIKGGKKEYNNLTSQEQEELASLLGTDVETLKNGSGNIRYHDKDLNRINELLNKNDKVTPEDLKFYEKLRSKMSEDKSLFIDDHIHNRILDNDPYRLGSYYIGSVDGRNDAYVNALTGTADSHHYIRTDLRNPGVLGHEYGHKLIEEGKAGKINQKLQRLGIFLNNGATNQNAALANMGHILAPGIATGATGFKVDDDGNIKFRKSSLIAPAVGTLAAFAHTHHEKQASKQALKALKELGASSEALAKYKEQLLGKHSALDTYRAIRNGKIAGVLTSSAAGYGYSGLNAKQKSEKIKKEKEKN